MRKVAMFVFNGSPMCFVHVLLNALDMHDRGDTVQIVMEGESTQLVAELSKPDNWLNGLWQKACAQKLVAGACKACAQKLGAKQSIGILVDLLGSFKVLLVAPIVLEFTLGGRVITTDLWSSFVDPAPIILSQMLAGGVNQQVPVIVFDEDGRPIMQQIPTHKVEVLAVHRLVNRQDKIVAAFCRAVLAQIRIFGKIAASLFRRRSYGGHGSNSGGGWMQGTHSPARSCVAVGYRR